MESAGKMPKYSVPSVKTYKEEPIEKIVAPKYSTSFKAVRLMIDAKVNVTGYVTGNSYKFNGAGSVVEDVDERDVENLLSKRQGGRQCCGGTGYGNVMFELA